MCIGVTGDLHRTQWGSFAEFLNMDFALTVYFSDQQIGKGVNAGYTDAMQTS
mgnify:CR=1 FL=1